MQKNEHKKNTDYSAAKSINSQLASQQKSYWWSIGPNEMGSTKSPIHTMIQSKCEWLRLHISIIFLNNTKSLILFSDTHDNHTRITTKSVKQT